jgi:Tol biopolymer transport system component
MSYDDARPRVISAFSSNGDLHGLRQVAVLVIFVVLGLGTVSAHSGGGQNQQKTDQATEKAPQKKGEQYRVSKLTQGSGLQQLGPVSPDRKMILLIGKRPDHAPNLYIMDLSSRRMRPPLTDLRWGVSDPIWSRNGGLIALSGFDESSDFAELYTYDLGTRDLRRLTRNRFADKEPIFTPDSKRLLYTTDESPLPDAAFGILHVASIPVSGGKGEYFTDDETSSIEPEISPDQTGVLLVKIDEESGRHSLWEYGKDGKARRDLTGRRFARIHRYIVNQASDSIVIWGQEQVDQQEEIYILKLKTGEVSALPMPDLPKYRPALSPDGKLIAFVGAAERGSALFVFDVTTGEIEQLTFKGTRVITPVFVSQTEIFFGSDREGGPEAENEIYSIDLSVQLTDKEKEKDQESDKKKRSKDIN